MWHDMTVEDAQMRLSGCVVRYLGVPVYITGVRDGAEGVILEFHKLGGEEVRSRKITNPDWDFRPVPLGYVNHQGTAYFVERQPIRKWKHGLHPDNMRVYPETRNMNNVIKTNSMSECILREYPAFGLALDRVKAGKWSSCAFHQLYAFAGGGKKLYLMYRGEPCGTVIEGKIALDPSMMFLSEEIAEVLDAA